MPTYEELNALYTSNPQQYQTFMNSVEALQGILSPVGLRGPLGEMGTGAAPSGRT